MFVAVESGTVSWTSVLKLANVFMYMYTCWVQVEYAIVRFDHAHKKVRLSLCSEDLCNKLQGKKTNECEK